MTVLIRNRVGNQIGFFYGCRQGVGVPVVYLVDYLLRCSPAGSLKHLFCRFNVAVGKEAFRIRESYSVCLIKECVPDMDRNLSLLLPTIQRGAVFFFNNNR